MRRALVALAALLVMAAIPAQAATRVDHIPPLSGPITRHFEKPPTPYSAGHRGIDFGAPIGTPVAASADGVVHFAGQVGGLLFVSIDHADGIRTTYSYLSAVLVKAGTHVRQGDPIGRSGAGLPGERPNLHFGMIVNGDYIDPEPVLIACLQRNLWRVIRLAPDDG